MMVMQAVGRGKVVPVLN